MNSACNFEVKYDKTTKMITIKYIHNGEKEKVQYGPICCRDSFINAINDYMEEYID